MKETYRSRTDEVGLRLNFFVDPNVGQWVIGDAGRAMQVLHNLIGNACKFTPLGGSVECTVHRVEDGETVLFEVRDTGPGVREDKREAIFESFVQVHDDAQPRPEGVGLGLAISRELARAMGGEIVYQARVGRGSVFSFTARLPKAQMPDDRGRASVVAARPVRRGGLQKTVLVADDDKTSLLLAVSVLRQQGYEVEEFDDGASLLERVRRSAKSADAIVLDLDMPQMSGHEVVKQVRADELAKGKPRVPMLCLSATALREAPTRLVEAGVDAFLAKPCLPETLMSELERCLAHATATAKVAALTAPRGAGDVHGR
jgi:CheY-like chemotaxis protein